MSRGVWEAVETKTRKVRMVEAEEQEKKRRSRKKMRRKGAKGKKENNGGEDSGISGVVHTRDRSLQSGLRNVWM